MTAATIGSRRLNAAFSPDGRRASCIRVRDEQLAVERWHFPADRPTRCGPIAGVVADLGTQTLPLDDGRVLLFPNAEEDHQVVIVGPADDDPVTPVGTAHALGGYFLSSPSPKQLGLLITYDDPDTSTIWRVTDSPVAMAPAVRIGGTLSGGAWLDTRGSLLAINRRRGAGPNDAIAIDLDQGAQAGFFSVSERTDDSVLLSDPRSGLVIVSTDATGRQRLGITRIGAKEPIHFPASLNALGRTYQALAIDPSGTRLLLHEQRGTVSQLSVYTVADDTIRPLQIPAGTALLCPSWTDEAIRLPLSTPRSPMTMLTIPADGRPVRLGIDDRDDIGFPPGDAELVEFEGPAGPIETIVYGGAGWRTRDRLVLALHGGPVSSWRLEFDPLFQALVRAGCAVVAPNCRGSVGYGEDHLRPIRGDWGGPDLDDVLHLAAQLERTRGRAARKPIVLGVSYGAYLGLLAAGSAPESWSACVAVAPFLSAGRLHAEALPWIGDSVARAGALATDRPRPGTRDLLEACRSVTVPVLLVHGTDDEVIPVEQSRALRDRLCETGRRDGTDFRYLEVPGTHDSTCRLERSSLRAEVVSFCSGTRGSDPEQVNA